MISFVKSLECVAPEATLLFGVLFVLVIGAFKAERFAQLLGITTLVAAIILTQLPSLDQEIFFGSLKIDYMVNFSKILVLSIVLIISLIMYSMRLQYEIMVLTMMSAIGMLFLVSCSNLMTLYMGLELMSLPLYVLATLDKHNTKASEAGIKYFILGAIASSIFLLGAGFTYCFTATLSFDGIAQYYSAFSANSDVVVMPISLLVGLVLMIVALSFKISAVPFHMWTPDVYQGVNTAVTMFLASAPKVAVIILFVRLLMLPFMELYEQWAQVIAVIAVLSMLFGSIGAIMQHNLKRMLAYSSIGHVGFILSGVTVAQEIGVDSILTYLVVYSSMTIATFALLLLLKTKDNKAISNIGDLHGLALQHKKSAFAIMVLMMSMAGIPPFAGFFAKLEILLALIQNASYELAIIFMISAVIAAFYYLRIVKTVYFDEYNGAQLKEKHNTLAFVITGLVAFNILYVILHGSLLKLIEPAAHTLIK